MNQQPRGAVDLKEIAQLTAFTFFFFLFFFFSLSVFNLKDYDTI